MSDLSDTAPTATLISPLRVFEIAPSLAIRAIENPMHTGIASDHPSAVATLSDEHICLEICSSKHRIHRPTAPHRSREHPPEDGHGYGSLIVRHALDEVLRDAEHDAWAWRY
ncbi:hypothetical protein FQ142_13325 [Microbacterium sp. ANT_H45B]|uniref:hypothetical protein n=1 Tax=Microbacterium sp. ANT_H45B TaxID=2597346 RepID=UPI0011ECCBF0|nr:hypothetical protein [Microbacterium sp. ANT_H45B]KAA0959844.1 hypothetical protein FQ142_13325 [Microbacterium sp. ANT_H45B]